MLLVTSFTFLALLASVFVYAATSMNRPPTANQLSSSLPGPRTILTGHDSSGAARINSVRPVKWTSYQNGRMGMSVAYTTQFHATLTNDADIAAHDALVASPPASPRASPRASADAVIGTGVTSRLGLVKPNGTVLRYVDIAPGHECMMHRTQSVDYGIVLEGEIVAVMGSGDEIVMGRGDVMVQRATMHKWRNDSPTHWARMIFCLQDCEAPVVAGRKLGEDVGEGFEGLPESGNSK
ncbi:hypothetical protein TD95_002305 [Thielaviopsis punctulata]|uniref:Cupin type-2 domain-containing protein n=1 Tax=Thielaviopsis punctulata TaxID=72032 RepID=A0A0F4ZA01_9PEZI|nr:hypothetical protein TD95_002305 [Thielaviopsis punctulata]